MDCKRARVHRHGQHEDQRRERASCLARLRSGVTSTAAIRDKLLPEPPCKMLQNDPALQAAWARSGAKHLSLGQACLW
jgi:hypothetical protein